MIWDGKVEFKCDLTPGSIKANWLDVFMRAIPLTNYAYSPNVDWFTVDTIEGELKPAPAPFTNCKPELAMLGRLLDEARKEKAWRDQMLEKVKR